LDEEVYFGKKKKKDVAILSNTFSNSFYNMNSIFQKKRFNKMMLSKP